jgi:hypothetical protein
VTHLFPGAGIASTPFVFLLLWIDKDPVRKKKKEETEEPAKVKKTSKLKLKLKQPSRCPSVLASSLFECFPYVCPEPVMVK